MAAGRGPAIAPVLAEVPADAETLNARAAGSNAYVGMPLRRADGELFGTLRGFATRPQPDTLQGIEAHLVLTARLLSTVLELELRAEEHLRLAERALAAAERDALTGLANRRAWDQAMTGEEARCRRYGHPASVLVVDLDGLKDVNDTRGHLAGDQLLQDCAEHLRSNARTADLVARLSGDEFAVLLVECDAADAGNELRRVQAGLATAGIAASAGAATRTPGDDLTDAWRRADAAMYAVEFGHRT